MIAMALSMDWILSGRPGFGLGQTLLTAGGLFLFLFALALNRLPPVFLRLFLAMAGLALPVALLDAMSYLTGFDPTGMTESWKATPIFWRQPIVPVGEVFFRRPGPDSWTGRPLTAWLTQSDFAGLPARSEEKVVTIEYDSLGFRNRPGQTDWEIVIAGDSFTELGFLPDRDLPSSRIAQNLGVRVKNLGVAATGTFTHSFYLREYGVAPSTTDAVLVFFEGNDIDDAIAEDRALRRHRSTGEREERELGASSSLVLTLLQSIRLSRSRHKPINARLRFEGSAPTSAHFTPPNASEMSAETRLVMERALGEWARAAASRGLRPWLVFMPCKRRVLDGYLEFLENAPRTLVDWRPSDLAGYIRTVSEDAGIRFLDVTPELVAHARRGSSTYNVVDVHLNRLGAAVVGDLISEAIGGQAVAHDEP